MACVAIAVIVSITAYASLLAVLHHLEAMRPTTGEVANLRASVLATLENCMRSAELVRTKQGELELKLQHLDNRTKR